MEIIKTSSHFDSEPEPIGGVPEVRGADDQRTRESGHHQPHRPQGARTDPGKGADQHACLFRR